MQAILLMIILILAIVIFIVSQCEVIVQWIIEAFLFLRKVYNDAKHNKLYEVPV